MKLPSIKSFVGLLTVGLMLTTTAQALSPQTNFFTAFDPYYEATFSPETGSGSFAYDLDKITGIGTEWLGTTDGRLLSFRFELFGQTFTETDDVEYPFFPLVRLQNGTPDYLNFFVSDRDVRNTTLIIDGMFSTLSLEGNLVPNGQGGYTVGMTLVPEPSSFALLGIGVGALLVARSRRQNSR